MNKDSFILEISKLKEINCIFIILLLTSCSLTKDISPKDIGVISGKVINNFNTEISIGHKQLKSEIYKEDISIVDAMETTPFIFNNMYYLMISCRNKDAGSRNNCYEKIIRVDGTNDEIARIGTGTYLASAFAHDNTFYIYGTQTDGSGCWVFYTKDFTNWQSNIAYPARVCNTSVCFDGTNFIMAAETTGDNGYITSFAVSKDGLHFSSKNCFLKQTYCACPTIRYSNGYYYCFYLNFDSGSNIGLARSKNLTNWEESPRNPILFTEQGEGGMVSDIDLVEWNGEVHFYYCASNQVDSGALKRCKFIGNLDQFFMYAFSSL